MRLFESPLRSTRSASVLVGAAAALIYANSLRNQFAYDDVHIITENEEIHTLAALPKAVTEPYWPGDFGEQLGLWRPTTTLVLGLEYAVSGENPAFYHLVNVLGHAGISIVVVLLLAELMSAPAAFAAGLIFAVHPVHVEAVSNVIGIAELLPALLFLLACLVHVRGPAMTRWPRALLIAFLYLVAFGGKESAATLPAVLFLLDAARDRLGFRDLPGYLAARWRLYVALAVVGAGMLVGRLLVLGSIAHPFGPLGADLLREIPRIWTLCDVWSNYVRLWVFPLDLSSDYSPDVIPISFGWNPENLSGLVLALGILTIVLLSWHRSRMGPDRDSARAAGFGVMWFCITILPVSNILFLSGVMLAERTLYLPSVGLAAATGWLVVRLGRVRPRAASTLLATCLALMGWRTWTRTPEWYDNLAVFGTLIRDYPHSGRSQWIIGDLFFLQDRTREGLVSYRAAIDLLGTHYQLLTEIARKLMAKEYYRAAEHLLRTAWKEEPGTSVAPEMLAVIASEQHRAADTEHYCEASLAAGSTNAVCYHLLAWAYAEQDRWPEAVAARSSAIARGEGDYWQQWESLAFLQHHRGDTAAARISLDSARAKAVTDAQKRQIDSLAEVLLGGPGS